MKLMTRDTDYAVRAICFIARHRKKVVSVSELVKALKIPRPFLRKILQILHKKGLLKSYKGLGGGFLLALTPERILLVDLIKVFQGPFKLNECFFKKEICPNTRRCRLKEKIDLIEKDVLRELETINIAYLLK